MERKGFALILTLLLTLGAAALLTGCGGGRTYEGVGRGRNGDITAAVTLDADGRLAAIRVKSHSETPEVGTPAFDALIPLMVAHNTTAVEAVSSATITSRGLVEAVENALVKAGRDPAGYRNPVSAERGKDITYVVDVAVVGGGGAGMAAAASAASQGSTVLVLEKTASLGGGSKISPGSYDSADARGKRPAMTDAQREAVEAALRVETDDPALEALRNAVRMDYDAWRENGAASLFDSANWHALQTYTAGDGLGSVAVARAFAREAPDTMVWLRDVIGIPFRLNDSYQADGGLWPRSYPIRTNAASVRKEGNGGQLYIDKLSSYAEKLGAVIETGVTVTALTRNSWREVTGCEAVREDGAKITVRATNVVLATGGFGANGELVREYSGGVLDSPLFYCAATSIGDGLALAEGVGAELVNLDQILLDPFGDPVEDCGCTGEFAGEGLDTARLLLLNRDGIRFVNEAAPREELCRALLDQPGGEMWVLVDSRGVSASGASAAQVSALVADGHSLRADTLGELAALMGVDPDTLAASVTAYNAGMDGGTDAFGKEPVPGLTQAPFYASLRAPTVGCTMGGVAVNANTQVVSTDGRAIPHLFAAGEVTGSLHGAACPGNQAFTDAIAFGRLAGLNAAASN